MATGATCAVPAQPTMQHRTQQVTRTQSTEGVSSAGADTAMVEGLIPGEVAKRFQLSEIRLAFEKTKIGGGGESRGVRGGGVTESARAVGASGWRHNSDDVEQSGRYRKSGTRGTERRKVSHTRALWWSRLPSHPMGSKCGWSQRTVQPRSTTRTNDHR